jgi:hypothetical protein
MGCEWSDGNLELLHVRFEFEFFRFKLNGFRLGLKNVISKNPRQNPAQSEPNS